MLVFATPIVDTTALWKIIVAALVGGAGTAIMFGFLLLGLSRAARARTAAGRVGNYALTGFAGLFCVAAVVFGVYAMAKKPASAKKKAKTAAALVVPRDRNHRSAA